MVLFDPDDRGAPPCLNVLQGDGNGGDTDVITDNLTGIFRRIYAAFWGPRTDDIFRSICLTLLRSVPPGSGQVTLADIPALLDRPGPPAAGHRHRRATPCCAGSGPGRSSCHAASQAAGDRAADEQAPRVPAPQIRPRSDRGRPVHLRP